MHLQAHAANEAPSLSERFAAVRDRTLALCAPLEIEDYGLQSSDFVSPPKWHLAHTTWFFETFILLPYAPGYQVFHPAYAHLFNSYYETAGTFYPRPQRGWLSRPTVAEVKRYRAHVDAEMRNLLRQLPGAHEHDIVSRVTLGIEHEIQHQELLLMDTHYNLAHNPLHPAYQAPVHIMGNVPGVLTWSAYRGGLSAIGHAGEGFCFDNERPRHQVLLRDFRLANRLITNGEYLDFITDGGYQRAELWLSDGWQQVKARNWNAPLYWQQDADGWQRFTLSGLQPLDLHQPVANLSYLEADAYARWAGKRLPTEAEWEHAAASLALSDSFLESGTLQAQAATGQGLTQMFGELWQWTQSPYTAYPGFHPLPGTLGEYNGKFMSDQWVLRGGSCLTPEAHLRATYRNFFRAADRWMYSGLRLAEDA
ncbi:MAG: ergothioneine biosynthesis protein EgtB [Gallionella sp.]|nr:ergothioneine biosynthesis protein EgtB [Gallionella sp.]